jgi:DNA-binding LacI/PurR family transcriptional regulator
MPTDHLPPATLGSVADLAGVSRQTVSNALNAPERLRPDTLRRVLEAVDTLGYLPNKAARSLRSRRSKLVGLPVGPAPGDKAGPLLDRFLHALVERCAGEDLHVLLFTPSRSEDELSGFRELLATTSVDAFVLTDTHRDDDRVDWLRARDATFVAFGRPWGADCSHAWVDVDGAAGTAQAVEHLVRRGHTRIGFVGWSSVSDVGEDRRRGWAEAMQAAGLDAVGMDTHGPDTTAEGTRAGAVLLDAAQPPTALVCASDTLAMGVLALCQQRSLVPGRDLAVTGFDDSAAAAVVPPGLTSVRQPLEDVAGRLVGRLQGLLTGRPLVRGHELLAPTLVIRGTT